MTIPGPDPTPDEEDLMSQYLKEAGDPTVAPDLAHAEQVRAALLGRLGPPRRFSSWRTRLVVGSGLAALALVACALLLSRPKSSWAQVVEAIRGRPWVHATTLGPDGKVWAEAWYNPLSKVIASRHGTELEYHDDLVRAYSKYVPAEDTIYRLPETEETMTLGLESFHQLIHGKRPNLAHSPGLEVVDETEADVAVAGKTFREVTQTLRVVGNPDRGPIRTTLRIDPTTNLPASSTHRDDRGNLTTTAIDYPATGPADIHDLGAPRTARVVDRVPADDLKQVLAGLKAGRVRFDDYKAFVISARENVSLVYRKGPKWRVESLQPPRQDRPSRPKDADLAWWQAHQGDYIPFVSAICDGKSIRYYRPPGNAWIADKAKPPTVELTMTQAVSPSDDPMMPWPHLAPEQLGHPSVWQPSDDRVMVVDPQPGDGPPGTIRLRVSNPQFAAGQPDLYRLWIKPTENYLAFRSETAVFESTHPPKISFIDTQIIESTSLSPGGHAYPTRVKRTTSNFPGEQITDYHLDFRAVLPDELFEPLKP